MHLIIDGVSEARRSRTVFLALRPSVSFVLARLQFPPYRVHHANFSSVAI